MVNSWRSGGPRIGALDVAAPQSRIISPMTCRRRESASSRWYNFQAMLSAGTRLGSYEVISAIGAGGMGEVYKGRDTRLDRIVVLKVLRRRTPPTATAACASNARRAPSRA